MVSTTSILNLGKYSLTKFVNDWLTHVELCNLDTAFCNEDREFIQHCLYLLEPSERRSWPVMLSYLKWLNWRFQFKAIDLCLVQSFFVNQNHQQHMDEYEATNNVLGQLKSVQISPSTLSCQFPLKSFLGSMESLEDIQFSNCKQISDEVLLSLRNSPNMKICTFIDCLNISDAGLITLGDSCLSIKSLKITSNSMITDAGIVHFATCRAQSLISLALAHMPKVTANSIVVIAEKCVQLTELSLAHNIGVSRAAYSALAKHSKQLKILDISYCQLEGTKINEITSLFTRLSDLNVRETGALNNNTFMKCTALRAINLSCYLGFSDTMFRTLTSQNSQLSSLSVYLSRKFTASALNIIAENCASRLVKLGIEQCTVEFGDDAVQYLSRLCPNLTYLCIENCSQLTDVGAIVLAQHCRSLRTINLSNAGKLTDAAMEAIGIYCKNLTSIDHSHCSWLTDKGVSTLARGCGQLTEINMMYCALLTDDSLHALALHCAQLIKLACSHCPLITEDGIIALSSGCRVLQTISFRLPPPSSTTALQALKANCKDLSIIRSAF